MAKKKKKKKKMAKKMAKKKKKAKKTSFRRVGLFPDQRLVPRAFYHLRVVLEARIALIAVVRDDARVVWRWEFVDDLRRRREHLAAEQTNREREEKIHPVDSDPHADRQRRRASLP